MSRPLVCGLAAALSLTAPVLLSAQNFITTVAGNGTGGFSGDGGLATNASLRYPAGVAVDAAGNLYIADQGNHRIRKVTPAGAISTLAGNGVPDFSGDGGPATMASLQFPSGVAVDRAGNLYIADTMNFRIRKVATDATITTFAGNGTLGFSGDNGPATSAMIGFVSGLAADGLGNLYLADRSHRRVRKVTPEGTITTIAGNGMFGFSGDGGPATSASLGLMSIIVDVVGIEQTGDVAVDMAGNVYIADTGNARVRKVGTDGRITTIAGIGTSGLGSTADGALATHTSLDLPTGLAVDGAGNVFLSQTSLHNVRMIDSEGLIFTVAGTGSPGFSGDLGIATEALLDRPFSLAVEAARAFFIADKRNHRVRKVQPKPRLATQPSSLDFRTTVGINPPAQTLTITNLAGGSAKWTAFLAIPGGANWAAISPSSGNAPGTATIGVSVSGLGVGEFRGNLVLLHLFDISDAVLVPVRLTIAPAPMSTIGLTPRSLQFGASGGANPPPQTFRIENIGASSLGWTASVRTNSGGNWLAVSPTSGTAPSTITVTVDSASLDKDLYTGDITIAAAAGTSATNSPQVLPVTLAVGVPAVGEGGIVNGASFARDGLVSPGSIASLFGTNLAARTEVATGLPLPTTLAGSQVLVNNVAAPLFFVSPSQINLQMPVEAAPPGVSVVVVSDETRGPAATVQIVAEAPGIFTILSTGIGQGAILNENSSINSAANPAAPGTVVQIFATGLGATSPSVATGQPGASASPFNVTVATPTVRIGGFSADVTFSAVAPGFVGLYQVNARVPLGTALGDAVPLQIQIGGRTSNLVTLAVR